MRLIDICGNWSFRNINDEKFVNIDLPHDAMIIEKKSKDFPSGNAGAFFSGGIYEYIKIIEKPEEWENKKIVIEFEGVYKDAKVFVNEKQVGDIVNGYVAYEFDISKYLNTGSNTLKVEVHNADQPNSRWYTGSGIYRPVKLHVLPENYIVEKDIKINTLNHSPIIVESIVTSNEGVGEINLSVFDDKNALIYSGNGNSEFSVENGKLWNVDSPNLYTFKYELIIANEVVDIVEVKTGFRTLRWDTTGFYINDISTKLQGGCIHHDNGIVGAITLRELEYRKVKKLKDLGFNALRASHNPMSNYLIEACDELGMYYIDETWDSWYNHKSKNDYAKDFEENFEYDLKAMIKRDYNHPSVIMYSIGNEISESYDERGLKMADDIIKVVKDLDTTRPITCGTNLMVLTRASQGKGIYDETEGGRRNEDGEKLTSSTLFNFMTYFIGTGMNKASNSKKSNEITKPFLDKLDIAGYNYTSGRYKLEAKENPNRIIVGTETFPQDIYKNWSMVEELPYLLGDFVWTAWDYLGEGGIGSWTYDPEHRGFNKPFPWLLSETGVVDILGNPGASAHYINMVWDENKPSYMGVRPIDKQGRRVSKSVWRATNAIDSYAWAGSEGLSTIVEVYSRGREVSLYLNDKKIKTKKLKKYKAEFKIKYQPGVLKAVVVYENGEVETVKLHSANKDLQIDLIKEENNIDKNIDVIELNIVDSNGVIESGNDDLFNIEVEGADLLAFGSAIPISEYSYAGGKFRSYYGRAQIIIKNHNKPYKIKVKSEKYESKQFKFD